MKRTRRVKVVTGLKCNIRCVFCYYQNNLNAPNRPVADIAEDLRHAWRNGIREVDFSGGEPTVHKDLPVLISMAKDFGIERVCIISNGWCLAEKKYFESLKQAGLDEVLFSVQGADEASHDSLTATRGSFKRILEAMTIAGQLGITVRTNTVVNRINVVNLRRLGEILTGFKPAQVNFITINDWCYAKNIIGNLMVSYVEMSPHLQQVCDFLGPLVPAVNVRYIPLCFMQGYESFVCNHRQVPFDIYEWVPHIRCRLEEQNGLLRYLAILGYGLAVGGAWKNLFSQPFSLTLDDCVTEGLRVRFYLKGSQCAACRYFELCDGVERTYAKEYGVDELLPVAGEKLFDPAHFRSALKSS